MKTDTSEWKKIDLSLLRNTVNRAQQLFSDCHTADPRHGDDGCAEVFSAPVYGVTSAQPQRNIDAVRCVCSSTASVVA